MFGHYYPGRAYPGEAGEAPSATYSLAADSGAYAVTGSTTGMRRALRLAAAVGAYALSGVVAGLAAARLIATDVGVYALTGSVAALKFGYLFACAAGVYALTGLAATFRRLLRFRPDVGAYVLAGLAAALKRATPTSVRVYIGGVDQSSVIRLGSLEVEDVLNDAPNRCSFTVATGYVPEEGQVVIVTRGVTEELEFAGHVLRVQQFYEGILANVAYHVTCEDYTWKLNRRLVTRRWANTSATTIAQQIISGSTSGFTSTNVVAGLATVAEFECRLEEPSRALTRLCAEIGGNWYVDYELDLHLFITEVTDTPDDISDATLATTTARGLAHTGDLRLIRTRVKGTGAGTTAAEHIVSSSTQLPVAQATMFESGGGSFMSGANIGTYAGRHVGGTAGTVAGNVAGPGSAPSAAVASGVVGVLAGDFQYKVAFANDQGETTPSSASGTVTGVAFAAPTTASVAASGVIGPLIGVYLYVLTYVTALGETTGGSSFGRTATAVAAPGAPALAAGSTIGNLIGAYGYRVTFVTPFGETEGGTVGSRTAVATATPTAPSVAAVSSTIGNLIGAYGYKTVTVDAYGNSAASSAGSRTAVAQSAPSAPSSLSSSAPGPLLGTYGWKVAFVGPDGKETIGTALSGQVITAATADTPTLSSAGGSTISYRISYLHPAFGETAWSSAATDASHSGATTVSFTGLSDCSTKIYSTGTGHPSSDPYYHVATVPPGTTSYVHNGASGPESFSPTASLGKAATFTIPVGPTGTVSRRIYRTTVGGSAYYLCGEVGDNSTTTFTDRTPDTSLTIGAPTQNLNGEQHTVSSIATGATGTLYRDIYRTEAGGSTYYFLRRIYDNSTTSFTDNATDAELDKGRVAPSAATSGDQHAVTSIPTGPSGTTARRLWRTAAGGSIYYLLHTIPDNVTTSYTDNKADSELGADAAPTVSTAGGQVHALTAIPTGPTGTLARRLYRTVAGGTSYQFVGELTDNVTTTFTDAVADSGLSQYVPLVNTAGANKIAVSSIPTGGSSVTKRILYRTEAGGSVFKYVATINDNSTTTYTDNTPDSSLGREALTQSTIGAIAGDTSLLLSTVTGWPTTGWLKAGSQLLRWAGISGTSLTGIPGARAMTITRSGTTATATTTGSHGFTSGEVVTITGAVQPEYNGAHTVTVTGATTFTYTVAGSPTTPATGTITVSAVGAILASIQGGSGVVTAPFLSGVSGLTYAVEKGAPVRLYVVRNDTAAQTTLAALEGGDGIHESPINDGTINTVAALTAACDAELDAYSGKLRTVTFRSRDPKLRTGKTITLSLGAPTSLSGDFLIQRVISTEFDTAAGLMPMRDVIAAPVLVSFQDVLRRARSAETGR